MKPQLLLPTMLLVLATATPASANPQQAAQEAYAAGAYDKALAIYDSLAVDQSSAALFFNMGNCHAKLNDVPRAILFYERALRITPGAEDIQANLDAMRARTVDRMSALPAFTLGTAWDRLRGGKDVDQWARRALLACLLTCIGVGGAYAMRRGNVRNATWAASAVLGLYTMLCVVLAGIRVREAESDSQAIILSLKMDVLGEPRAGATPLFLLHGGTKLQVLQRQGEWWEVKLANGSVGWARATDMEVI